MGRTAGVQLSRKGASGGKSGLAYGDAARDVSAETLAEARERAGVKDVKGHRKGKSGSGESSQTIHEREKVVDALREMRAEAYQASRPKANEYVTPKMDGVDKAKQKAIALKAEGADSEAFRDYLTNRTMALPTEVQNAIEYWLEIDDDPRSLDQFIEDWLAQL